MLYEIGVRRLVEAESAREALRLFRESTGVKAYMSDCRPVQVVRAEQSVGRAVLTVWNSSSRLRHVVGRVLEEEDSAARRLLDLRPDRMSPRRIESLLRRLSARRNCGAGTLEELRRLLESGGGDSAMRHPRRRAVEKRRGE